MWSVIYQYWVEPDCNREEIGSLPLNISSVRCLDDSKNEVLSFSLTPAKLALAKAPYKQEVHEPALS